MSAESRIIRALKAAGFYFANLIAALIGTAFLESTIWRFLGSAGSMHGVLLREWVLSTSIAGSVGFYLNRRWPHKASIWIWVVPIAFLSLRILSFPPDIRDILRHFFYPDCVNHLDSCHDFFTFTVPALRTTIYSLAAMISLKLCSPIKAQSVPS
jgi:hypothetical protein